MAIYRIGRIEATGEPGAFRLSWVGSFNDEFYVREEARKLAASEQDPAVIEYIVYRTFPRNPPENLGRYIVKKPTP